MTPRRSIFELRSILFYFDEIHQLAFYKSTVNIYIYIYEYVNICLRPKHTYLLPILFYNEKDKQSATQTLQKEGIPACCFENLLQKKHPVVLMLSYGLSNVMTCRMHSKILGLLRINSRPFSVPCCTVLT